MSSLHPDEVDIDRVLVLDLLADQCPELVVDALVEVEPAGTDNRNFCVTSGADRHVVRLPRKPDSAHSITIEQRYVRLLGPHLPVAVPVPHFVGAPGRGYPFSWSISLWLPGQLPQPGAATPRLAVQLAEVVAALRAVPADPYRADPLLTSYRTRSIEDRDQITEEFLPRCAGWTDVAALTRLWRSRQIAPYEGPPRFAHTDLQPGNLLVDETGRLTAVIDFGGLAVGDPTVDLLPAWQLLDRHTRPIFRDQLGVDDATWARGRAWALSIGVVALGHYAGMPNALVARSQYQLQQVLDDQP